MKFRINEAWNINLEGGYRFTFTDYLDDVSTIYIDRTNITDPVRVALIDRGVELGQNPQEPGSNRGNADADDGYAIFLEEEAIDALLRLNSKWKRIQLEPQLQIDVYGETSFTNE